MTRKSSKTDTHRPAADATGQEPATMPKRAGIHTICVGGCHGGKSEAMRINLGMSPTEYEQCIKTTKAILEEGRKLRESHERFIHFCWNLDL